MKLTANAIAAINKNPIRLKLAQELRFTETWIRKLIKSNKENGDLTTATALKVIREETGLPDTDILESSEVKEVQN
jgi:hypothetical protein